MAVTEIQDVTETAIATDRIPVIDVDVHPSVPITSDIIKGRLSVRARDYLDLVGLRNVSTERTIPPQRKFTHRLDAVDPSGRTGVVPEFTRGQLLDEFDMSGAVLGDAGALALSHGNSNFPVFVGEELCRAHNDAHAERWIATDDRYYPLINVLVEQPEWAAAEIHRVRQTPAGDHYPGILLEPRSEHPIGNPKYWPIFEACEDEGIAVAFHVSPGRRMTPSGNISYYYEWHCQFTLRAYTVVSSLIFEGVFDRFPGLKVALVEVGMYWAVPFSWRLDHSWKLHREEVPHLQRRPSDYFKEHFYFSTQPIEEPDDPKDYLRVVESVENTFGPDRVMFASDYPHWDFDSPYFSVPRSLPDDMRRRILGENASKLFNIPLRPGTGISAR